MITRIRELLEDRQLSPTQFADLIGVGRPVISHILSERNKPSLEVVQKIIGAFPDISLPWLLAGTGPMLAATAPPAAGPAISVPEAVQSPVSVAPPPPVAVATPPAPAPSPVAAARPTPVSRPGNYNQPPRFRPRATATVSATLGGVEASPLPPPAADALPIAPVLPSQAPPTAPVPPTPASKPASVAPVAVQLPPAPAPYEDLGAVESPTTVAEVSAPAANAEVPAPAPHPAAALSFLGEPGKAIRRIVIFYRDGSFSDYLPEGY